MWADGKDVESISMVLHVIVGDFWEVSEAGVPGKRKASCRHPPVPPRRAQALKTVDILEVDLVKAVWFVCCGVVRCPWVSEKHSRGDSSCFLTGITKPEY